MPGTRRSLSRFTFEERWQEMRVLLIEDEARLSSIIQRVLRAERLDVDVADRGDDGLEAALNGNYDVLIVDRMLPGMDGITLINRLREDGIETPALMLSALSDMPRRVEGLNAGVDDYLAKPFAFEELLARVRALLRRSAQTHPTANAQILSFDDLAIDQSARTVRRNDRDIDLSVREYDLLTLFLHHPNQVLPRATIMSRVWGDDFFGDSNVLEVTVGNLRRQLESGGESRLIQTVRGTGYVLRQA